MESKTCSRCKETKTLELFSKNSRMNDGKDYICKECRRMLAREYKYKNPDTAHNWYMRNREKQIKKSSDRAAEYYRLNKDRINARRKELRDLNNSKLSCSE